MKITDVSIQARNPNRVNVSVNGSYRFSLDLAQVVDFGIKKNQEIDEERLHELEGESEFGKLHMRALEYALMRPHSTREMKDYLYRKTRATKYKARRTGEIKEREGVSQLIADRVYDRLIDKGYVDDAKFCQFWIESRNQTKGSSLRKLVAELRTKGVAQHVIDATLEDSSRNDEDELAKMIAKKAKRYDDPQKLMQYLARQGFSYDDIKQALCRSDETE